jgi:hypothetical protein
MSSLPVADFSPSYIFYIKINKKSHPLFIFSCCLFQVFINFYPILMDKTKLHKTITTVLNGHNYVIWSQDMRSFLKSHRLWCYVMGDIQPLLRSKDEDDMKLTKRLEDWDCKNHQIITWFHHSTVPSIHQQFSRYDMLKMFGIS